PDEGGELACDRRDRDGLKLAFPGQRPVARAQAALRLPGDLTNGSRRRRHPFLLLLSHSRRMLIAPGTLHQNAARPTVAGLGDGATLDRIPGRSPPMAPGRDIPSARAALETAISARNAVAEMKSMPRIAIRAVTTSANDQSGTATRIACSSRSMRSCAWRI